MSVLLESKRLRLALNAASYGNFTDQLTTAAPKFPKADLRIEVAAFYGRSNNNTPPALVDIGNWTSLTCTFKPLNADGSTPNTGAANLAQRVVLAAALRPALTQAEWDGFTHAHAVFDFTEAEINNITVGKVWVVFSALLASGKVVPVQFGTMEMVDDGYQSAGTTAPSLGTAWTKEEADARYAQLAPINGTYRVKTDETGSYWQLKNATTGGWHTVFLTGAAGAEAFAFGPGEDLP